MTMLNNVFYILIFVSAMGGLFTPLSLFAGCVLKLSVPLWFSICGMVLYALPLLSPEVTLFSPEEQIWQPGFYGVRTVWALGILFLLAGKFLRAVLAHQSLRRCRPCPDPALLGLCSRCALTLGITKLPALYYGTLKQPACATGVFRPAIILNEAVGKELTEEQLTAVLSHELLHLRQHHLLWERIYDFVLILNWINPLVWIARKEFSLRCEMDCDRRVLAAWAGRISPGAYARTMLRLMELTSPCSPNSGEAAGALRFLLTKRRIRAILHKPSRRKIWLSGLGLSLLLALILFLSLGFSRQHFYPYPAYRSGSEYTAAAKG